jgi:hypothetical protein
VKGVCVDKAGNVSQSFDFGFRYDATPPVVKSATAERAANTAGWFTGRVRVDASGADATSGLAGCPPVTYAGPDSATASIAATCRDRAGNVAGLAFDLKYDATPPALGALTAAVGDRRVTLRWPASAEDRSVRVVRSPPFAGAPPAVMVNGPRARFVDTGVANRKPYRYEIRAADQAGNVSSRSVVAIPRPHLLEPARAAVVAPGTKLLLRWTPVRLARYYNVQLLRDRRIVLSRWPVSAQYRLRTQWFYGGRSVRLVPGHYRWIAWPGFGARSKGDYGARIGLRKFTVRG